MLSVDHKSTTCVNRAMLIPCGTVFEEEIRDLRPGDMMTTYFDEPPKDCKVLTSARIPIRSAQADALAMLIYGYPIEVVFDRMKASAGRRINKNFIHLIVYVEL